MQVFAKAEWFNPGGSIKDRPALNIIRAALADGRLGPGKRLIDATSGNTGIAYATFGAALDIPVTLALPANASRERITILETLGAELLITDPLEGIDGAIRRVRQEVAEHPERYFYANQYDNPANWQAHYFTTGPEIVQQTQGQVTHFAAGLGTSGTLMGVGRYLKHYNPAIQVIAGQPDGPFHGLEGLKHMPSAIRPGHLCRGPGGPHPGDVHRERLRMGAPPGAPGRPVRRRLVGRQPGPGAARGCRDRRRRGRHRLPRRRLQIPERYVRLGLKAKR